MTDMVYQFNMYLDNICECVFSSGPSAQGSTIVKFMLIETSVAHTIHVIDFLYWSALFVSISVKSIHRPSPETNIFKQVKNAHVPSKDLFRR